MIRMRRLPAGDAMKVGILRRGGQNRSPSGRKGGDGEAGSTGGVFSVLSLLLHVAACCGCLAVGYRLSRWQMGLLTAGRRPAAPEQELVNEGEAWPSRLGAEVLAESPSLLPRRRGTLLEEELLQQRPFWPQECNLTAQLESSGGTSSSTAGSGSRVGRHGILIREDPHPRIQQVALGHELVEVLQEARRRVFDIWPPRRILAITPTYKRTFQTMHVLGLINSLKLARAPVTWIVVEAGAMTNDTAFLLEQSGLEAVHLVWPNSLPERWHERELAEVQMRELGIR